VRVVLQQKRGAAAARNAGIAIARGDFVATTDVDCIVHRLWLKHLVAAAINERKDAVGGRIVNVSADPVIREFCERESVLDQQAAVEGRLLPFPFAITANALFRRDLLASVGGFDEDFDQAAAEDVDLGWRIAERGGALGYAPNALVAHPARPGGVEIFEQYYRYGLNEVNLYLKHRDRFSRSDLSKHLWIRPVLYCNFWKAVFRWLTARNAHHRRLWRLVVLKELGHMAGKIEGAKRRRTWRYFRLWTYE